MRDARFDVLFEPVRIGPKQLKNRFYAVPHSTGWGSDMPESHARFSATAAAGGWAAVSVAIASMAPESDRNPVPSPARLWDDDDVANLALVCRQVHEHGALAGIELWHCGSSADLSPGRIVAGAPSQFPNDAYPLTYPRELRRSEIGELVASYADAARRARDAGFDIVYVYGAHGYLPAQFLSPFYNRRDDEYGGTLINRSRFWREAIEAVREAVEGSCALAVRIGIDPSARTGCSPEETAEFIRIVDDAVDLWDVNTSVIGEPWLDMRPSRLAPQGYQIEWVARVRDATSKPIVGVSRLTDPEQMAAAVRSGPLDLIGAARPAIADPYIPRKLETGRADEIRECIGCNVCILRVGLSNHLACTQNATTGEEFRRGWHPEHFAPLRDGDRGVLIVGAGVAGMECAIVLARRGARNVHLVDAAGDLGGYASLVARLPRLGEWGRLVDWRRRMLGKLGVELTLGTRWDASLVAGHEARTVVVATGARWVRDGTSHLTHAPIPGWEAAHVATPEVVLGDLGMRPERALVYDCEGYLMGVGVAEVLAERGARVTYATPHAVVAPTLDRTFDGVWTRRRLTELAVTTHTGTTLTAIEADGGSLAGPGEKWLEQADLIVLVTARRSEEDLLRSLETELDGGNATIDAVFAIGDCVAPRLLGDCIFDGHRLAREIDSSRPERPLAARRERRVVAG
jgi:dimethylamine/trimethylamine dehydrogenase